MDAQKLLAALKEDEGFNGRPYLDTTGHVSVGYGRNLTDNPLTRSEAEYLLRNDVLSVCHDLDGVIPWWRKLDDVRGNVIANMAYNLGVKSLLGFSKMLGAAKNGDYADAAKEMRNSKWYSQVGQRGERLAKQMESGMA